MIDDKAAYAAGIVSRWESSARTNGKWDANAAADLYVALMKLQPENLLAAGEASTYEAMMAVVAAGSRAKTAQAGQVSSNAVVSPNALGDVADDMVSILLWHPAGSSIRATVAPVGISPHMSHELTLTRAA